jgi:hypothetical protein
MKSLHLNDTEVCTSSLTQRSFRAAACEFLVCVNSLNQTQALKAFGDNSNVYSGLHVAGISDVSFLADFPSSLIEPHAPGNQSCLVVTVSIPMPDNRPSRKSGDCSCFRMA